MVNIYYKNQKLDKYRTAKSIIKYYYDCYRAGIKPNKVIIETEIGDFSTY